MRELVSMSSNRFGHQRTGRKVSKKIFGNEKMAKYSPYASCEGVERRGSKVYRRANRGTDVRTWSTSSVWIDRVIPTLFWAMSFRVRRRAKLATDPSSNRTLIEPTQPAIDAPIPTFVDRVSEDRRRVYRKEVPVEPPSPVKRNNAARLALVENADAEARRRACDEPLPFELYRIGGDDDTLDDNGNPDTGVPTLKPIKPSVRLFLPSHLNLLVLKPAPQDKSLSDWRSKVDLFASEYIRLHGRRRVDIDCCPGCGSAAPKIRCRDCHGGALYCEACCVVRHAENPLHRVYVSLLLLCLREMAG